METQTLMPQPTPVIPAVAMGIPTTPEIRPDVPVAAVPEVAAPQPVPVTPAASAVAEATEAVPAAAPAAESEAAIPAEKMGPTPGARQFLGRSMIRTIRMTPEVLDAAKAYKAATGTSVAALAFEAVSERLTREGFLRPGVAA